MKGTKSESKKEGKTEIKQKAEKKRKKEYTATSPNSDKRCV